MTPEPITMAPSALLWSFELQREKRSLTQCLTEAKCQIDETELLVVQLSTCLKDLTVIVASVAVSLNDQTPQGQQRLRHLRSELHEVVEPLYRNARKIIGRNDTLLAAIAKLRGLQKIPDVDTTRPPPGLVPPNDQLDTNVDSGMNGDNTEGASSPLSQALLGISSTLSCNSSPNGEQQTSTNDNASRPPLLLVRDVFYNTMAKVMKQDGRSIGEYFDVAHEFRRRGMLARGGEENDKAIIEAFLLGLDSDLYRRRFIHWLRKEHWTWSFVFHYAQILIMEEEYMAKQEYALEHKFEDGSVLFPDGERSYRFSYLPPITDADLTASEDGE